MRESKKVLFVTWDGSEVNYLETLFAPIFRKLQIDFNYEVHIIQFTWAAGEKIQNRNTHFKTLGMAYTAIPLSGKNALVDLIKARYWHIRKISKYIQIHGIQIIMPRAITSFFLIKPLIKKHRLRLIWDADGFPLDERVDFSGLSPLSIRYRYFRDQELQGLHLAHALICRSKRAKEIIQARAGSGFDSKKVYVVNNGTVEDSIDSIEQRDEHKGEIQMIYVGSAGPQYLIPQLLDLVQTLLPEIPSLRLIVLTYQVEDVKSLMSAKYPILATSVYVKSVKPEEIPSALQSAHIGIAFRVPSFSMQGVAPIKIAEYLAAGLSILYSSGTGDLDQLLANQSFAFCVNLSDGDQKSELIQWIKEQATGQKVRAVKDFAVDQFGLDRTVEIYRQALQYARN